MTFVLLPKEKLRILQIKLQSSKNAPWKAPPTFAT